MILNIGKTSQEYDIVAEYDDEYHELEAIYIELPSNLKIKEKIYLSDIYKFSYEELSDYPNLLDKIDNEEIKFYWNNGIDLFSGRDITELISDVLFGDYTVEKLEKIAEKEIENYNDNTHFVDPITKENDRMIAMRGNE